MRTVGVVTGSRADYGIYVPLLRAIVSDPSLELSLLVTGTHLSPEFGSTVSLIEADGFRVSERVEMILSSDTPEGIGKAMGLGMIGFTQVFSRYRPEILVLLGDRFDMLPAALSALPFGIPMAHIHGGEATEGLIDEAIRHSLTKLSHLHFASTEYYACRIIQMGEEPWRITISGALGIDTIRQTKLDSPEETARRFGFSLDSPVAVITFHPVTLAYQQTQRFVSNLLSALDRLGIQCLFTYPNADTASGEITRQVALFCAERKHCRLVVNAGQQGYLSLLNAASVMVGNSSSGIIEAASFKLPVVNIGLRQRGRAHPENVLDCGYEVTEIVGAMTGALDPSFRAGLANIVNPYGDGNAAERIVERLASVDLGESLLLKHFYELDQTVTRKPC